MVAVGSEDEFDVKYENRGSAESAAFTAGP
jgi:hypothetical protein